MFFLHVFRIPFEQVHFLRFLSFVLPDFLSYSVTINLAFYISEPQQSSVYILFVIIFLHNHSLFFFFFCFFFVPWQSSRIFFIIVFTNTETHKR